MKLTLVASLEISSGLDVSGKVDGFFFFNIPTNYSFSVIFAYIKNDSISKGI